jgi:hypothetical protein
MVGPSGVPLRLSPGDLASVSYFEYVTAPFVFVANENQQQQIQIQYDSHFLWVHAMYDSTANTGQIGSGGATVANGGSLVQITDGKGPWQLSNGFVPVSNLFGTAQRPYVLPWTHVFIANSFIGVSLTGTTGAAQTVRLVFGGYKIPPALYEAGVR